MTVLDAGGRVVMLRFLPDGRRLLAGVSTPDPSGRPDLATVRFVVHPVTGGEPVTLDLPPLQLDWWWRAHYGSAVAVTPDEKQVYVAWDGTLYARRTDDGRPLPLPGGVAAHQVVLSPGGDRLFAAELAHGRRQLTVLTADPGGAVVVRRQPLTESVRHWVGLLPGGDRAVVFEHRERNRRLPPPDGWVLVRAADSGAEVAAAKNPSWHLYQPAISPDGRRLGVIGYAKMYVYDLPGLGKPRAIGGTATYGDFRSYAFHPDGRTLAVIHGGPTLLKLYNLETLKQTRKYNWKVGPLTAVAFSPDGQLGAVGTEDGRVAVWDVDAV